MSTITTKDGTQIYYKDWGTGQPVVFSHGWPLSADAWDDQMLYLAARGLEHGALGADVPGTDQSPAVQRRSFRRAIGLRDVPAHSIRRCETLAEPVADVGLG